MAVVSIILILASISLPKFTETKIAVNEAAAQRALTVLNNACFVYRTMYQTYPTALGDLRSAELIGPDLASGVKSGYKFAYNTGKTDSSRNILSYTITADPIAKGSSGQDSFATNEIGVIQRQSGNGVPISAILRVRIPFELTGSMPDQV